jgi:hypothetical protein
MRPDLATFLLEDDLDLGRWRSQADAAERVIAADDEDPMQIADGIVE